MRKELKRLFSAALALLMLAAVCVLPACGDTPENMLPPVASGTVVVTPAASIPTNVEPSIRGYITRITYAAEYTEILVEYFPESEDTAEFSYTKVLVKLDDNSAVAYGRNNDTYTRTLLSVGSQVEAWFSDPTLESYPVLAYGQAVRVVTAPGSMTGMRRLPYLSVASGSTCITVVTEAEWNGQKLEQPSAGELLETVSGAHMSAAPGDIITMKFSSQPRDIAIHWSTVPYSLGRQIPMSDDGKIVVPEEAEGKIYFKIDAEWGENSAQYAFSVAVQDITELG